MTPVVTFKRLEPAALLPEYAHAGDAGMDLFALADVEIAPGATVRVRTGIAIAIPPGYFGSARERSGYAAHGIRLGGGVIDSGYRGEIVGILTNLGREPFKIARRDRFCQIIIQPVARAELVEAKELPAPSDGRGAAGFGSTGR